MDDRMARAAASMTAVIANLITLIRTRIAADREPVAMAGWHGDYCVEWDDIEDGRCVWCGEAEDPTNIDYSPRSEEALRRCDALSDVLTELERIAERSSDPDARMTARSAMGRMALVWLTVDELDAKMIEWGATDG